MAERDVSYEKHCESEALLHYLNETVEFVSLESLRLNLMCVMIICNREDKKNHSPSSAKVWNMRKPHRTAHVQIHFSCAGMMVLGNYKLVLSQFPSR